MKPKKIQYKKYLTNEEFRRLEMEAIEAGCDISEYTSSLVRYAWSFKDLDKENYLISNFIKS